MQSLVMNCFVNFAKVMNPSRLEAEEENTFEQRIVILLDSIEMGIMRVFFTIIRFFVEKCGYNVISKLSKSLRYENDQQKSDVYNMRMSV